MAAINIALEEIQKRKRSIIYTDFQSSMQSIKYSKEDQINNTLVDLEKYITLCEVLAHEADKVAKQTIDMPGMTSSRLCYTDYYLTIRRVRNSEWQRE